MRSQLNRENCLTLVLKNESLPVPIIGEEGFTEIPVTTYGVSVIGVHHGHLSQGDRYIF